MHPTRDCQGNIYLQYIMFTIKTVTPCGVWFGPGGRPPALKEVMGSGGHFPEVDAPEVGARLCMAAASTRCIDLPCVSRCSSWCGARSFAYRYWYRTSGLRIDRGTPGAPAHIAIFDEVLIGCVRMRVPRADDSAPLSSRAPPSSNLGRLYWRVRVCSGSFRSSDRVPEGPRGLCVCVRDACLCSAPRYISAGPNLFRVSPR